ncbi:hypothetical protein M9H77_09978 [Catharanthus roseus]|uniref:Uncharacterized protein n=1 Tax=Catharanthus roseus TaxID=4058 RepID=A0ACC0C224_CATRO|nr:hypothetical protein M9H77_09978 [Catharanthus roseus]
MVLSGQRQSLSRAELHPEMELSLSLLSLSLSQLTLSLSATVARRQLGSDVDSLRRRRKGHGGSGSSGKAVEKEEEEAERGAEDFEQERTRAAKLRQLPKIENIYMETLSHHGPRPGPTSWPNKIQPISLVNPVQIIIESIGLKNKNKKCEQMRPT